MFRILRSPGLLCLFGLSGAAAGLAMLLAGTAWLFRPKASDGPAMPSAEEVRQAAEDRDLKLDLQRPPVLYRHVDYSQGPAAAWYPKGEPPILADLVREGVLRPLVERIGPEPAVMEGVEGIGTYGGTWIRAAISETDAIGIMISRMSYSNLVRFSPYGYPIVPHMAKGYEVSSDDREFTFTLRRGMRWSDGQPFTAADILYWWRHEANDRELSGDVPPAMTVAGKPGTVEKLDDYRVRFRFPQPYGLFLAKVAGPFGHQLVNSPAHYRRQYHPVIGDKDLIERTMRARKLPSARAVYSAIGELGNPEHPRLWPWVYRTYKPNPPQAFVRNPYYCVVDTRGNQLPYIDRLLMEVKSGEMIGVAAASGQLSCQARNLKYDQYTLLMSQRRKAGYDVRHWYSGDRSTLLIAPNLNRRTDDAPDSAAKHALLNDKRFRQALSLAINRRAIIDADLNGQAEPAQVSPGPESFFHEPATFSSFTDYDPASAGRLLDELGLTHRDYEGCRTFADGSRMTWFLNMSTAMNYGSAQFVIDDFAAVGLRVVPQIRSRPLFYVEKAGLQHDLTLWGSNGEFFPLIDPRNFLPFSHESNFAPAWAMWYSRGGFHGNPRAGRSAAGAPPEGHPVRQAIAAYERALAASDPNQQRELFRPALKIAAENVWTISVSTPPPQLCVVQHGFRNVPRQLVYSWDFQSPGNGGLETYYFEKPSDSPGAVAETRQAIRRVTPQDDALSAMAGQPASPAGKAIGGALRYGLLILAGCLVALVAVKHPYIARRLLIMVPTLLIISVVAFTIIQLPPGDFLTSRIMQLQESGDTADLRAIEDLSRMFQLQDSAPQRYVRWLGLRWFITFDGRDAGLLQGNLGRSMESGRLVNDVVGDRILLTVLISLGTVLFTWVVAIPTGIYSAVKQYSVGDYVLTCVGFLGMCVPSFLLALVLIYAAGEWFDMQVSGLFSARYGAQPEWTWGKFVDLLQHIWIPVLVLGVGGTAGMIRVMRGNLLDELRKPYVVTARAKGVGPTKLLLKYPVRLALNPFISSIGGLFPHLVSGGAIVAMVLSLPTVGPLMLSALMTEDMYLAGSMLMVLSLLGVLGTLVSDLLLLWLDPRIRFKGGSR
jgi:ABC-type dipeptide/oligopeptide/nickel transport system permease component/ABC-type transport system substrate-binding protein